MGEIKPRWGIFSKQSPSGTCGEGVANSMKRQLYVGSGTDRRRHDPRSISHGHRWRLRAFVSRLPLENHPDQPEWLSRECDCAQVKLSMASSVSPQFTF